MLGILILIFLILKISRSTEKAKKNLFLWILIALAFYISIQLIIAGGIVLVFSIGERFLNWQHVQLERFALPIIFFSEFFSLLGVWTIANYLSNQTEIS
jgi:hypothetical protein